MHEISIDTGVLHLKKVFGPNFHTLTNLLMLMMKIQNTFKQDG